MAFIEKISKDLKETYIDTYIDFVNQSKIPFLEFADPRDVEMEDSSFKPISTKYNGRDFLSEHKDGLFLKSLEDENVFVRFYYTNSKEDGERIYHDHALFFTFTDSTFKVHQADLYSNVSFPDLLKQAKYYYLKNMDKIKCQNEIEINKDYISTFISCALPKEDKYAYIDHIKKLFDKNRAMQRKQFEIERKELVKDIEKELG